jgi:hypothetical protein
MKKKDLLAQTRKSLLEIASKRRIPGRSAMSKEDLVAAILKTGATAGAGVQAKAAGAKIVSRAKKAAAPIREKVLVRKSWREQQAVVQQAKYEAKKEEPKRARPARPAQVPPATPEPPPGYGRDLIALLVRDPYWIHVYWEISRETLVRAKGVLRDEWFDAKSVLRVHDVTGVDFDGKNSNSYFDIGLEGGATNWYINTRIPNRSYCVEIGLLSRSGRFVLLARSNVATTPRDAPSDVVDEKWMIPDLEFDK